MFLLLLAHPDYSKIVRTMESLSLLNMTLMATLCASTTVVDMRTIAVCDNGRSERALDGDGAKRTTPRQRQHSVVSATPDDRAAVVLPPDSSGRESPLRLEVRQTAC